MKVEKLRKKAEAAWEGCHWFDENDKNMWVHGYIIGAIENQIELPSDEEIKERFTFFPQIITGAKWMKEQILNQNK